LQTHPNGPLTVNGAVTASAAAPSALVTGRGSAAGGGGCTSLVTPATGKALVIKAANLEFVNMTAGSDIVDLYRDGSCSQLIGEYPVQAARGSMQVSFGDGVTVKNGQSLSAVVLSSVGLLGAQFYGYAVLSAAVPS
jgi:hypothetical protein